MPGIVGLITKLPKELAERQLRDMLQCLCHEPFYVSGTWTDADQGVYVGWVAREGSFSAEMPVHNESRDVALIFSGEEFSEKQVSAELRRRGHTFSAQGPSYLVHRYEEDRDFPKQLNGRFHGLIADRRRRTAMLFNDRFGLQRLYYHEGKDGFYFAAEAKAILRVCPELRETDIRGVGEFVVCGCVLENRTLFKGIQVLPPGAAWVFRGGALDQKATYFSPSEWEDQQLLDPETYYAELRDAFVRRLPLYFDGPEGIGVSLTGGLDTRIIMAWRKPEPGSLPCYTFGSMYRDNEDVKLARKIANVCGQSHNTIVTGKDFLSRFSRYAERTIYLSDACVDLSRSPDLYVNEKAREIAPVRMVGTYGSEMLLHLVMFKATQPVTGLFQPEMTAQFRAAEQTYLSSQQVHPVTFVAFRQSPWNHFGILGLEQTQLAVRTPFLDNEVVKLVYRAVGSVTTNQQGRLRLVREGDPALADLRTDIGVGGQSNPLLHGLLKFLFKAEYAYDYGMPQWVARVDHLFAPLHLERLWLGRHKPFHFRVWYRDELADYVREMLLDSRSLSRSYVESGAVQRIVKDHLRGNRNYTLEIHRLLALELTHRLLLES